MNPRLNRSASTFDALRTTRDALCYASRHGTVGWAARVDETRPRDAYYLKHVGMIREPSATEGWRRYEYDEPGQLHYAVAPTPIAP